MHNKIRVSDVLIMTTLFKEIPLRFRPFIFTVYVVATAALAILSTSTSRAQNWTWDITHAHTTTGSAASGTWDNTTANWWNGLAADVAWGETSTTVSTNGAIFAGGSDAADGTYVITLSTQIAATNILVNNSGYKFASAAGTANGFNIMANGGVTVAAGKINTVSCPVVLNSSGGGGFDAVSASSVLNLVSNVTTSSTFFVGQGTINLSSPSYTQSGTIGVGVSNLNFNAGTWTVGGGANLYVAYSGASANYNGGYFGTATLAINGGTLNQSQGKLIIVRAGGTGAVIVNSGAINFWTSGAVSGNSILAVPNNDNSGNDKASLIVNGGVLNMGSSATTSGNEQIQMMSGGGGSGSYSYFTQTGGAITNWGGILIGYGGPNTYNANTVAAITNSGGILYLGSPGITRGTFFPATINLQLSGGIWGALANWSTVLPVNLATLNGNITFQCADAGGTAHNITLSGALTGAGGFNKTGGGTLQLSGANNYAGTTVVSNGILQNVTGASASTNGTVILDGSAGGSPTYSTSVQNTAQYVTNSGNLTFAAGTMTADFNYGGFAPSTVTAPLQVSGSVNFTATPAVTVEGSAIPVGTYPLIQYSGSITGTMPTTPTSLPASTTAYITNIVATKTIALVVTTSPVVAGYVWSVGSGIWDFTTLNWKQFGGSLTSYVNGQPAQFDDTAPGPFPIIVANNSTVSPAGIIVSTANTYTLAGNGTIAGAGSVTKAAAGTLTMSGTNTYTGGTTVSGGQLNINFGGGISLANSAIGTGPLTISGGAMIDNTSGHTVTLLPVITNYWSGSWTFVGSTNLNTGAGPVTLTNSAVTLTVASNVLAVGGAIIDNGYNDKLIKGGSGTLTLNGSNSAYGGGFELSAGQLNIGGDGSALGSGTCTIIGGSIDNVSGSSLTVSPTAYVWSGSFSYLGTSNNLNLDSGAVAASGGGNFSVNVVTNTLITQGNIIPGNNLLHKTGQGTWDIAGSGSSGENLNLSVDQGTVLFDKTTGLSINGSSFGLIVQSNALAKVTGSSGSQIGIDPVSISTGGVLDLNGHSETVFSFTNANGVLRNSAVGGTSSLTISAGNFLTLTGTNCVFDVPDTNGVLNISAIVAGSGTLVKTGFGALTLSNANTYTGSTVISNGVLALGVAGSIASTPLISVGGGATFDVSAPGSFTLGSQVLSNSAAGTGSLNGNLNTGSGTVSVSYAAGTPALNVTNGTLTLSTATTFQIYNPGTALAAGSYKIISKATAGNVGSVTGTLPAVTETGAGVTAGTVSALALQGGELYLVADAPPLATTMTVTRTAGLLLTIALSDVATNWTDGAGSPVSLLAVTMQSTNGVNLYAGWTTNLDGSISTSNGAFIGYTNSPNVNDQISYAIGDGFGATNVGYINIVITNSAAGTNSIVSIVQGNPTTVTAYGVPNYHYVLQRTTSLSPAVWVNVQTNQALPNGQINLSDSFIDLGGNPPSSAFYQLMWNGN
jgi:fibronectin-binding autotransporter adhesin